MGIALSLWGLINQQYGNGNTLKMLCYKTIPDSCCILIRARSVPDGGCPDGISRMDEVVGVPYVLGILRDHRYPPEKGRRWFHMHDICISLCKQACQVPQASVRKVVLPPKSAEHIFWSMADQNFENVQIYMNFSPFPLILQAT